jgi:hypothetical protein
MTGLTPQEASAIDSRIERIQRAICALEDMVIPVPGERLMRLTLLYEELDKLHELKFPTDVNPAYP